MKPSNQNGFTLIELLIVVAIIGVLAAVGVPAYQGYIKDAKETTAQNNLRSIYLMEQEYYSENHRYYGSSRRADDAAHKINTVLFGGKKTLDENGDYFYSIRLHHARRYGRYKAVARSKIPGALREFRIDDKNQLLECVARRQCW